MPQTHAPKYSRWQSGIKNTGIQISMQLGDCCEETIRFFAQIGVETVSMPVKENAPAGTTPTTRPLVPPTQRKAVGSMDPSWDEAEMRRIHARFRTHGIEPTAAQLELSGSIFMGKPDRDKDLEIVKANIATAGRVGLSVLTYRFTALRASEGYRAMHGGGRAGADYRDFDAARVRGLPPLPDIGEINLEFMWENVSYFLRAVIPTAEAANIRLALHPNDPPMSVFRGVAQPLSSLDGFRRLLGVVDSPANSMFFDTGIATEMGEDAAAAIREFGGRNKIAAVHFRNVKVDTPYDKYIETFHDVGDCDMAGCMDAFQEVGYRGPVFPDHTPEIEGDMPLTRSGWAFAIGQIIAYRAASRKAR